MSSKKYPRDTLSQATDILAACKQISPDLSAGPLSQADLEKDVVYAQNEQAEIAALEVQLTNLRNRRDQRLSRIWDAVKRMRATVKGTYGDDSDEYDLIGGTRRSDRKRPARTVVS